MPEQHLRKAGHTGKFIDRRFGEDNPHVTPEERALERFTRAREIERGAGKPGRKAIFNLNDEEDGIGGGLGFGDDDFGSGQLGAFKLTHGGRAVDDLKGDDFRTQGLDDDDDEVDDDFGINATEGQDGEEAYARRAAMGAYGDGEDEDVSALGVDCRSYSSFRFFYSLNDRKPRQKLWLKSLPRVRCTR